MKEAVPHQKLLDCHLVITVKLGYTSYKRAEEFFYAQARAAGRKKVFSCLVRKGGNAVTAVYWLGGIIVLLIIEALTLGLTTIWFAGGALAAFIACVAGADLAVQIVLFVVVSLGLLFFTRPFAKRYINRGTEKTNVEGVIGREARVTEQIDNRMETGEAVLAGQYWSARAAGADEVIGKGERVIVEAVEGVKLIVRKIR